MDETLTPGVGSIEELRAALKGFDAAMLVTRGGERVLRARPMEMEDPWALPDCDLWFVSADDSPKVDEVREEQQVCVCCFRPSDGAFLSLSAVARIDDRPGEVKRLWKPEWKLWLPDDPADGTIAILKLTVEHAEYWQPDGGRMRVLYSRARSVDETDSAEGNPPPPRRTP